MCNWKRIKYYYEFFRFAVSFRNNLSFKRGFVLQKKNPKPPPPSKNNHVKVPELKTIWAKHDSFLTFFDLHDHTVLLHHVVAGYRKTLKALQKLIGKSGGNRISYLNLSNLTISRGLNGWDKVFCHCTIFWEKQNFIERLQRAHLSEESIWDHGLQDFFGVWFSVVEIRSRNQLNFAFYPQFSRPFKGKTQWYLDETELIPMQWIDDRHFLASMNYPTFHKRKKNALYKIRIALR